MATITHQQPPAPRSSQETERRHLLSPSQNTTPTPSAATSVINFDDPAATPRARSPAPQTETEQEQNSSYRGFPSEAAYLEALQQWAESKKWLEPEVSLQGYFGTVTMEEYAGRPKLEGLGLRRKVKGWRQRREAKGQSGRVVR